MAKKVVKAKEKQIQGFRGKGSVAVRCGGVVLRAVQASKLTRIAYTVTEIYEMTGLTAPRVKALIEEQALKVLPASRCLLISRESLYHYLEQEGLLYDDRKRLDVLYARAAWEDSRGQMEVERQVAFLHERVSDLDITRTKVLKDVGVNKREAFQALLGMVKRDKVGRVCVVGIDRLTYEYPLLECLLHEHETSLEVPMGYQIDERELLTDSIIRTSGCLERLRAMSPPAESIFRREVNKMFSERCE